MDINDIARCTEDRLARLKVEIDDIEREVAKLSREVDTKIQEAQLTTLIWVAHLMLGVAVVAAWIKTSQ